MSPIQAKLLPDGRTDRWMDKHEILGPFHLKPKFQKINFSLSKPLFVGSTS